MKEFLRLTKEINDQDLEQIHHRYFYERKFDRKNYDDFNQMKAEATPIFVKIEEWEEKANEVVHKIPIFPNQIKNTKDNLEIMILHSYFNDVRKKRFVELYQSVRYNLNLILQDQQIE